MVDREVQGARKIDEMTYDEATELAYFGGKVIHPDTMAPCRPDTMMSHAVLWSFIATPILRNLSIPLSLRSSFDPEESG